MRVAELVKAENMADENENSCDKFDEPKPGNSLFCVSRKILYKPTIILF